MVSLPDAAVYAAIAVHLTAQTVELAPDSSAARAEMLRQTETVGGMIMQARVFVEQCGGRLVKLVVPAMVAVGSSANSRRGFCVGCNRTWKALRRTNLRSKRYRDSCVTAKLR